MDNSISPDNLENNPVELIIPNDSQKELREDEGSDISESESMTSAAYKNLPEANLMSKKEKKRMQNREAFHEKKRLKKEFKKQQLKEKKELEKAMLKANQETENQITENPYANLNREEIARERSFRKADKGKYFLDLLGKNFDVIIDCDWEAQHNESALKSLTQQIMFSYGSNRKHPKPVYIHLSNLKERTRSSLERIRFFNWLGVTTSSEDYLSDERYSIQPTPGKKQLVYLSSEATETLQTLSPDEAYIIGGIVDRNRFKGVTFTKAQAQGLRTAKLPIKENYQLSSSQVLTVNHVFDILLAFTTHQNWAVALGEVLPKRKEPKPNQEKPKNNEQKNEQFDDQSDEKLDEQEIDPRKTEEENKEIHE